MIKKIDELTRNTHFYLDENDSCYYFGEYTSGTNYSYSPTNSLISNFKKSPSVKGTSQWKYKRKAIEEIADLFRKRINFRHPENLVLVPIPPSKMKDDIHYDDRMVTVLELFSEGRDMDLRELIVAKQNRSSFHSGDNRLPPEELVKLMEIDEELCENMRPEIVLFDDVITTGSHFKACKNILLDRFPNSIVYGIFIARRSFNI